MVEGLTQYESLTNTPESSPLKTGGRGGGTGKRSELGSERKEEAPAPAVEVRVKVGDKGVPVTPGLAAESSNGHVTKAQNGGQERELEQAAKGAAEDKLCNFLRERSDELVECKAMVGELEIRVKMQGEEIAANTIKALEVTTEHAQARSQLIAEHNGALKESLELTDGHK